MKPVVADVYKAGRLAATLTKSAAGVEFRYRDDYLVAGLPPVATTLPLAREPRTYLGGAVPPFFAGLLPEGRRLTALRRSIKASADDEFALLLAIGSDTVGDVQIVPHGAEPERGRPLLELPRELSSIRFADLLAENAVVDRVGLPGVQDKVSGRMINLPATRAHERLVVKLAPPEFPHVVENEAYFLGLARTAGLRTVDWRVVEDGAGVKALLVTRFDRVPGRGEEALTLACEDACQVLSLWPADKYNVSMEQAAAALMDHCSARAVAARDLFRQVVFAVLTGNGDLHAKNLSILATAHGEWRISPAYDLPSTVPYGDDTLALSMRGSKQAFSRKMLLGFADEIGLRPESAARVIETLIAKTEGPLEALNESGLPFARNVLTELRKTLSYRRRLARGG